MTQTSSDMMMRSWHHADVSMDGQQMQPESQLPLDEASSDQSQPSTASNPHVQHHQAQHQQFMQAQLEELQRQILEQQQMQAHQQQEQPGLQQVQKALNREHGEGNESEATQSEEESDAKRPIKRNRTNKQRNQTDLVCLPVAGVRSM